MKNKFVMFVTIIIVFALCLNVSAISRTYTYQINNVTIIFDESVTWNEQQREKIVQHLTSGETTDSTTYGLWCNMFGHSYESHSAEKITHCVYDTNPRCQDDLYEVQVCKRCEHTISTLIATTFISCCPEE